MRTKTVLCLAVLSGLGTFMEARAPACELLGFSCSHEVPVHCFFDAFRRHAATRNRDGWGLAFYPDTSAALFKEPVSGATSKLAEFLTTYPPLNVRLLVAHIRGASVGAPQLQNTHPFLRELGAKEYVLAHNGTIRGYEGQLKPFRIRPLGINDSEFLLCYLLGRIEQKRVQQWNAQSFQWLQDELRVVNEFGSVNCLLSDGTHLFAYRDKNGRSSLNYVVHRGPFGPVHFPDLSKTVDLGNLYPESAASVLIATKPVTDEKWTSFLPGQLSVFKDGTCAFSGSAGTVPSETRPR